MKADADVPSFETPFGAAKSVLLAEVVKEEDEDEEEEDTKNPTPNQKVESHKEFKLP